MAVRSYRAGGVGRDLVPDLFAPWGEDLIERMQLRPDEHLLDIGREIGIVDRRAAT